ncbi:DNA-binding LacI/PurR family transcriptional regulator [Kineococcus xinjiangensis]|uniref:DNA-binding LacI/PurR family transcriptional regulator n=1 Tax=Kineococcus xinjiangensis TaxID=512762 RepID=A0A2S6IW18_9ACTN|nr:LacI family DNA-binding transcriptional regulator [Kineococcus xinjiangensis]PPK98557.1 DNA-binding LacI/PurR family transcriptional regulator [Kineococcus xinjiangensis]
MAAGTRGTGVRPAPTLATVAAAAGVSPATVSRVVNGSATVSPEHREAVERAVARLGYVPNRAARSLVTRRTGAIALVVREAVEFGVGDPYLASFVVAASQSVVGTGVHLVVMVASDDSEHEPVGSYVLSGHVDGAILLSVHAGDPLPQQLLRAGVPLVVGGRPPMALEGGCYVDSDNTAGGALAAQRFLATGRRCIAAVSGPADMTAAADRLAGFRSALREAGRDTGLVEYGAFTRSSGERAVRELLEREPRIDAVFAASDVMALGVLRGLRAAGRRVPEDVAVIGFDDVDLAAYAEPPLTTVRQPTAVQARTMVEAVLAQIRGEGTPDPVVLPTELVVRDSA